ncbi:MAG: triose-phosphate isomerase [Bacteroidia bacterium]|jgi:triosephosphate isomerase
MRKKIVIANWKMNKGLSEGLQLVDEIASDSSIRSNDVLKVIAPSFVHLASVADKLKNANGFAASAQNCHHVKNGAYTGEVSAEMIASAGAKYVIIGHSERRQYFNENNELLAQKVNVALANNLVPVFCIGENLTERNANQHLEVVTRQMKESLYHLLPADFSKVIIAYEPVWAIGTGVTATVHQAQGMHNHIRSEINKKYGKEVSSATSILYGGSCNPQNARELFACIDVDGGLIGGASLNAEDFIAVIKSFGS